MKASILLMCTVCGASKNDASVSLRDVPSLGKFAAEHEDHADSCVIQVEFSKAPQ